MWFLYLLYLKKLLCIVQWSNRSSSTFEWQCCCSITSRVWSLRQVSFTFTCCHQVLINYIFNRSFEGHPDLEEFIKQGKILSEDLKKDGIDESDLYLDYLYMIKFENSVNEVFIVKKHSFAWCHWWIKRNLNLHISFSFSFY